MSGTRRTALRTVALLAVGALAACDTAGATPDVHQNEARAVSLGGLTAQDIAAARTAFGVDLLHALCGSPTDGNLLESPTSAAEALAPIVNRGLTLWPRQP